MEQNLIEMLKCIVGEENILLDEPMNKHTTFRIGGNADAFVMPVETEQIKNVIKMCKDNNVPYYIIGNGSNLLVSDNGFRGVIIQLTGNYASFEIIHDVQSVLAGAVDKTNKVYVKVQAGMMMGRLGRQLCEYSLSGFEFGTGIPGTVGGAVMMNAGAYGGEIKDIIVSAKVLDNDGCVLELTADQLELGYRTSIISKNGYVVLEAVLGLTPGNSVEINKIINELATKRKDKQPLEYPSAGSTFKRPVGYFAGKLISDAGLKGYKVGGAQVSEKHAGFVINVGDATAADVIKLTEDVKNIVKDKYGVDLELEVRKLGF